MEENKIKKYLITLVPLAMLTLAACEKQGPMEEAGEELDNAVEDARDKVDDAADKIEDSIDDATDEIEDRS